MQGQPIAAHRRGRLGTRELNVTAEDHETVAGFKFSLVLLEGVEKVEPGIVEIHD